ncbi:MAG: FecR family protein [Phycisphaerales bacterium]|nr:FecR family protein [Phycisphaerales bacterium]
MLILTSILLAAVAASAQDAPVPVSDPQQPIDPEATTRVAEIQQRLARFKGAFKDNAKALPEGQTRDLGAIVMQVKGRCQWRPDEKATWKNATVNDSLRPGALIRTGLNSMLTLRVGLNSTVLVDSNTRAQLPQLMQDGQVLRTIVTVNRGRADIQVDRVGLTNDFSVLTPSGSLAVKGTGMGVQYDGFTGTSVVGARHNRMNAIEMKYFAREGYAWLMSGGAVSTQAVPNPATGAALETRPAPSLQAYEAEEADSFDSAADQAMSATDTTSDTTRIVLAQEQQLRADSALSKIEEEVLAGILLNQEALLYASLLEAQAAAEAGIIGEEVAEIIEEIIEEEQDNADNNDNVPPQDTLELDGYRSYFQAMASPSDQGFLAAALVLDLVNADQQLGLTAKGQPQLIAAQINVLGTDLYRRRVPHFLEPALYSQYGTLSGARPDVPLTAFNDLPDATSAMHPMYFGIINYGLENSQWYKPAEFGGAAPTQADMAHITQIYEDYLVANPAVFGTDLVTPRQIFTNALDAALYQTAGTSGAGFTFYGNQLLVDYSHVYPSGVSGFNFGQ